MPNPTNGLAATADLCAERTPAPSLAAPFVCGPALVGGELLALLLRIQFVVVTFYVESPAQGLGPLRLDLLMLASSLLLFSRPEPRGARPAVARAPRPRGCAAAPARVRRVRVMRS